jgi:predicted RNA binding protein YcfA (HicA-like mRNA interferase family)
MRKKKPSGRLHRGPFTASNFEAALRLDGWQEESHQTGGGHTNWSHPTRPGKVQVDGKWTSVKPGHDPFKGIMVQTGYTKHELLNLLNGSEL